VTIYPITIFLNFSSCNTICSLISSFNYKKEDTIALPVVYYNGEVITNEVAGAKIISNHTKIFGVVATSTINEIERFLQAKNAAPNGKMVSEPHFRFPAVKGNLCIKYTSMDLLINDNVDLGTLATCIS